MYLLTLWKWLTSTDRIIELNWIESNGIIPNTTIPEPLCIMQYESVSDFNLFSQH